MRKCLITPRPARNALRFLRATMLGLAALVVSETVFAAGQSSANFAMPRDTINAGVANMSSTGYRLGASVGDAVAGGAIASVSFQLVSGFRAGVSAPQAVLNLLTVFSRKMHGATPFELTIANQPLAGAIIVEPRAIGGGHTVVFRFDNAISAEGAATALDEAMNAAATVTLTRAGNDVIARLTDVADNKRLTIRLTGVNNSTNAEASMGFLVGDVTSSRRVNAADVSAVKANLGKPLNGYTYRFDLNADGSITAADLTAVKARSATVIR